MNSECSKPNLNIVHICFTLLNIAFSFHLLSWKSCKDLSDWRGCAQMLKVQVPMINCHHRDEFIYSYSLLQLDHLTSIC